MSHIPGAEPVPTSAECAVWPGAAGHEVRLIPPIYVKPFVKRGKNDAVDAAAIATAVRQPDMRFVEVKGQAQQAYAMVFRTHQTLTRQRTQLLNTLRGHFYEHGVVVAKANAALLRFEGRLEAEPGLLPDLVLEAARLYYHHVQQLNESIAALDREFVNERLKLTLFWHLKLTHL